MNNKKSYSAPVFTVVLLDNTISLQLSSDPPLNPREMYGQIAPGIESADQMNSPWEEIF